MRHESKKIAKMIDEITIFFLEHQARNLNIKIDNLPDREIITIEAIALNNISLCTEELKNFLSYPRECEMEEYYWELAGEAEGHEELALVGVMIDEATIGHDKNKVLLELIRKK